MTNTTNTSLAPFEFEGHELRVITDGQGEPWFVASDVAKILGYRMASDMTRRLDDDERGTRSVRTPSGQQDMTVISEAGLYAAILGSRVPGAKTFKRWVTHEVLPAIRRHGGYLTPATTDDLLDDPDLLIRLATNLKAERAARAEAEALAASQASALEAAAPKVLFADAVATSDTCILVGDLAKILRGNGINIGGNRLFALLRARGFLIAREGTDWNMPTQRAMELGLFKVKETAITHSDGHVTVSKTPKVTGKGQAYFVQRFLDGRLSVEVAA